MNCPSLSRAMDLPMFLILALLAFAPSASAEDDRLHFKPELFEMLKDEWGCGEQCREIITSHCSYPDFKADEELTDACYLKSFLSEKSWNTRWIIKSDWIAEDKILTPEIGKFSKLCTSFVMDDYKVYVVESFSIISVVVIERQSKALQVKEKDVSEIAKKLFVDKFRYTYLAGNKYNDYYVPVTFDFVQTGEKAAIRYGYQRAYAEKINKERRGIEVKWKSTWYNDMLWWADKNKIGFMATSLDDTISRNSDTYICKDCEGDNGRWFYSYKYKWSKNINKAPELVDCLKEKGEGTDEARREGPALKGPDMVTEKAGDKAARPADATDDPMPKGGPNARPSEETTPEAEGGGDIGPSSAWIAAIAALAAAILLLVFFPRARGGRV